MFDDASRRQIVEVATRNGLDPVALLAVAWVESAGTPFWNVDGRLEPAIRFEGHYFDRILGKKDPAKQAIARARGLANPKEGVVKNPPNAQRYALLARAKAIDADAAIESVSWGLGQVMGANWRDFGLKGASQLEAIARSGVGGQVDLMVRFILKNGLKGALNSQNWRSFAARYNGPSYAANGYHTKMRDAYTRFRSGAFASPGTDSVGASPAGPDIRTMQLRLKDLGFDPGPIDGVWGPLTAAAVTAFQRRSGLAETGQLDMRTIARIGATMQPRTDPERAVETEKELAAKGSETIRLAENGRWMGIVGMIAAALGFTGSQTTLLDGLGGAAKALGQPPAGQSGDDVVTLLTRLVSSTFGSGGGGLWVVLAGLAFLYFRNSGKVAARRLEDHQQGWNVKY